MLEETNENSEQYEEEVIAERDKMSQQLAELAAELDACKVGFTSQYSGVKI